MRAVFADCHVGRQTGDEGPFLEALLQARDRGARGIFLLGDIFHFFIAHPKFQTPAIGRFLETVDRLRADGVPVTYVEGNRDFFLRGSYVESKFEKVCDEYDLHGQQREAAKSMINVGKGGKVSDHVGPLAEAGCHPLQALMALHVIFSTSHTRGQAAMAGAQKH